MSRQNFLNPAPRRGGRCLGRNNPEQLKKGEESIQIKWSTKGLILKEIHINLFKKEWAIVLKHLKERSFRMTWYFIGNSDSYMSRGISIDIKYDSTAYSKFFKEIDVMKILEKNPQYRDHLITPSHYLIDGEVRLKTFRAGMKMYTNSFRN